MNDNYVIATQDLTRNHGPVRGRAGKLLQGKFALSSVLVYVGVTAACLASALVMFQRRMVVV